jgi:phosphoglycerate dehydrogenase-like enzyme
MQLLIKQCDNDGRLALVAPLLDLSWETAVADEQDLKAFATAVAQADAIISMDWRWDIPAPNLKLLQLPGAGTDQIQFSTLPPATTVCNVFGHDIGIAEYVIAGMLEMTLGLRAMDQALRQDRWIGSYLCGPRHGELFGQTVGIVGYGNIGREVARRARAFGMRVIACSRAAKSSDEFAERVDDMTRFDALLQEADFIIVAAPLSDATRGLFDATVFGKMKSNAVIINIARGAIIDEAALYAALKSKRIAGAVIDTWYYYPKQGENFRKPSYLPFRELDNIIMTPHASAWTTNLMARRCQAISENLNRLARGEVLNNIVRQGHS